jgi:cation diffusion facilitator family transporter
MERDSNPYHESRHATGWGIGVNSVLGGVKLLGGHFGHSLALVADAVHSLVDAVISAALLPALVVAQRPADREHPYGHGRIEAVAGAGVTLILIGLAAAIAYESLTTIGVRSPRPAGLALVIAGAGAFLQELLYRYVSRVARRTGSAALLATAWDYRLHALGGVAVLIGLTMAGMALWIGGGLLWESVQSLIDRRADPELLQHVREAARAAPGVLAVEKLRVRRMGIEYIAEIHINVSENHTFRSGHDIAHAVKDRIMRDIPSVKDVVVHVEPFNGTTAAGDPEPLG